MRKVMSIRIDDQLKKELKKVAEKSNRSLNNHIETVLCESLKKAKDN